MGRFESKGLTKEDFWQMGAAGNVDGIIDALGSDKVYIRIHAVRALAKLGDVRAVTSLNNILEDNNLRVREAAAEALGEIGDRGAVKPLVESLADDVLCVRLKAAFALGRIGEPAIEPLIKALEDGNGLVREAAVEALRAMKTLRNTSDARVVQPLIKLLGDKNRAVRHGAAKVLGMIGDARAVEPLLKALGNGDIGARLYAAVALGKLGDSRVVEPLIKALGDNSSRVRKAAAEALGQISDVRAVQPLIKALKQGRSDIAPFLEKMPPAAVGAEYERLELYDDAEEWYTSHGMLEEAAAVRRKKAEMGATKVSQKVVHGDEVTTTTIRDSVVSRSNVGAGSSKMQELKELTEMKEKGLIDAAEFKQMKKEILGK